MLLTITITVVTLSSNKVIDSSVVLKIKKDINLSLYFSDVFYVYKLQKQSHGILYVINFCPSPMFEHLHYL